MIGRRWHPDAVTRQSRQRRYVAGMAPEETPEIAPRSSANPGYGRSSRGESDEVGPDFRVGEATMPTDRTGLLIIRTWFEEGSCEPLRAELRVITDTSSGVGRRLTLSRVELVCAAVERWLADFSADSVQPG